MKGYEQRLMVEKQELDARTRKLESFFLSEEFRGTTVFQHTLLTQQYLAMKQYSDILALRINA